MSFTQKAENAIRFYKNIRKTDANQLETLEELAKIKKAAAYDGMEAIQTSPLRWADFKTEHARKAIKIGIVLLVLMACENSTQIMSFTVGRFHRFESSSIIVKMLGIGAAMLMVDRFVGRKVG